MTLDELDELEDEEEERILQQLRWGKYSHNMYTERQK